MKETRERRVDVARRILVVIFGCMGFFAALFYGQAKNAPPAKAVLLDPTTPHFQRSGDDLPMKREMEISLSNQNIGQIAPAHR